MSQYSAAKAGINSRTRNLAGHIGRQGIRVNASARGLIKSRPRVKAIWKTRNEAEVLKMVAVEGGGEMDEIAQAAMFLASDASGYVTGAVLDVNGGFFAL